MLASRIGAFLLEPKNQEKRREDIATLLHLLAEAHRAKGGKSALEFGKKLALWASKTREKVLPRSILLPPLTQCSNRSRSPSTWQPPDRLDKHKARTSMSGDKTLSSVASRSIISSHSTAGNASREPLSTLAGTSRTTGPVGLLTAP